MLTDRFTSLTSDSRKVERGGLFVAVKGHGFDGHSFIGEAIEKGAAGIMYEDAVAVQAFSTAPGVEFIKVDNSRRALAEAACEWYGHPSRSLKLVGITGTNGKTTTVTLLYDLFTSMGYKCGLLSTIANFVAGERSETENTTSDPITINSLMRRMVDVGCEYCFMEVSSIGIEQDRVWGLDFNIGIFSNLTHEHLAYHGTFAEYLRCKKMFFDNLGPDAVAITNIDDRNGLVMLQNTKAAKMTFSCRRIADHSCRILEKDMNGMLLKLDGTELWCPLIGDHNASNVLAIYSAALALGAPRDEVLVGLSRIGQVKGRLEKIQAPGNRCVVIDYAHTPDALENVLKALRETGRGRELTCLFGCGGDRDRTKRPEMGEIAARLSDRIVITSDNSRSESTENIMEDIRGGVPKAFLSHTLCIADRKEAIRTAILTSAAGGIVLLAGKGHEDYQLLDKVKQHFDEREVVAGVLAEMKE